MRLLNHFELALVSGGLNDKFNSRSGKPTDALNPSGGKAIGWCWGYGNMKVNEPQKHPIAGGGDCNCCGSEPS